MTDPDVDAPRVRKSPPGTNSDRRDAPVAKDDVSVAKGDTGALVAHEPFTLHRLLVESVRDYAIFALDPKGHVVSWNVGAQRIKGYSADEIIGSHFSVFYPRHEVERGKPDWELEVASEVGRFEDEGWRVRKDGTQFWANVVITALRNERGQLVGFAKVTRDLTERKRNEERAIADARRIAAAEAANRTKGEFLAAMSHELRTPLNAIGGYSDLLALGIRGPVNDDQRQDLERIRRSQQHLLGIINDILNFSRIESGQLNYDIAAVPIAQLLRDTVTMIDPLALAKKIETHVALCGPEIEALADRAKVEQILINLLSNAIKFTESLGRVSVSCAATQETVSLEVSDTGIGIPPDKLEAVFDPFVQVGRTLTAHQEGTGLGLAISRDLARAMNGNIVVESTPGVGSTFTLTLPRAHGGGA
jgi:PAS domain S-box-containing protein